MNGKRLLSVVGGTLAVILVTRGWATAQDDAAIRTALEYKPLQRGVEIDIPSSEEIPNCSATSGQVGEYSGWIVKSPNGLTLRTFVDTTGDGRLDQWRYYQAGIEVYRDVDSNGDRLADQYRWLNTAGTRCGVDNDGDMVIDAWENISPEEVTYELVAAIGTEDAKRFSTLLLTNDEIDALRLGTETAKELKDRIAGADDRFRQLVGRQTRLTADSHWVQFSAGLPGIVPAGTDDSEQDLQVYENVMVSAETNGQHEQVFVGTLIRVGETWRLIDAPVIGSENEEEIAAQSFFFGGTPVEPSPEAFDAPNDEMQKLLSQLEEADIQSAQATTPEEKATANEQRADLLAQIIEQSASDDEREMWIQQMADLVSASVRSGEYPGGIARLEQLYSSLAANESDRDLAAFVKLRILLAEHGQKLLGDNPDYVAAQEELMESLEAFAAEYPTSLPAADAMLNLGMNKEMAGLEDEAKQLYARIVKDFAGEPIAQQAAGALRRLDSVGKTMTLRGKTADGQDVDLATYRGRVVVVLYWASWCTTAKSDMLILQGLLNQYQPSQLQVIGVNLDTDASQIKEFLDHSPFPWPQIHEGDGMEGRLATEMGVMNPPLIILVDQNGRVVNRNVMAADLDKELKSLLQ